MIEFSVFSMYISTEPGNSSHIKFGGWDSQGIADGDSLHMIDTISTDSLAVKLTSFSINRRVYHTEDPQQSLILDPSVQYIHVPEKEFV